MSVVRRFEVSHGQEVPWDDMMLLEILSAKEHNDSLVTWVLLAEDDEFDMDDDEDDDAWERDED